MYDLEVLHHCMTARDMLRTLNDPRSPAAKPDNSALIEAMGLHFCSQDDRDESFIDIITSTPFSRYKNKAPDLFADTLATMFESLSSERRPEYAAYLLRGNYVSNLAYYYPDVYADFSYRILSSIPQDVAMSLAKTVPTADTERNISVIFARSAEDLPPFLTLTEQPGRVSTFGISPALKRILPTPSLKAIEDTIVIEALGQSGQQQGHAMIAKLCKSAEILRQAYEPS